MNVYELAPAPDLYQHFVLVREEQWSDLTSRFDGMPIGSAWTPFEVALLRDDTEDHRNRWPSDFPTLGTIPVFSQRAVEALQTMLTDNGELLPLYCKDCEGGNYFAYNVTRVVDALDEARSQLKYFKDGGIMRVVRYEFRPDQLMDAVIFKIPQQRRSRVFVTDTFVQRAHAAHLVGFDFRPVWSALTP